MAAPITDDINLYLSQVELDITKTLTKEFPYLSEKAVKEITKRTLMAALHIRRVSINQRLKLSAFAQRLAREQAQIWLAVYGTSIQQTKAERQILDENKKTVRHFIEGYTFRTDDIIDDILNESFRKFFEIIKSGKPVVSTISTMVKGIARNKALKQLRNDKIHSWQWLETIYEPAGDDTIGTFDCPITADDEGEPEAVILHLPKINKEPDIDLNDSKNDKVEEVKDSDIQTQNTIIKGSTSDSDKSENNTKKTENEEDKAPETISIRVDFKQLQIAIADCFAKLKERRQLLLRIINTFWKGYKEEPLSQEKIISSYEKLSMDQVAGLTGYSSAHIVSQRLTETNKTLHKCLTEKLNLTNLGQ